MILSVFSPQGVTPTSKTSTCSPSQMVMQEKTQRFILVWAREGPTSSRGSVCIILHLSACTGVNTSLVWMEMEYGCSSTYVFYCVSAPELPLL